MIRRVLLALLLFAMPAAAQRSGCGLGLGLDALRTAERALRTGIAAGSLSAGRDGALATEAALSEAIKRLAGCGCPLAVQDLADAQRLVEQARFEPTADAVARRLDRAGFSLDQVRARLDRNGCS